MKKITLLLAVMALTCVCLSAQNADTIYFYKGGEIVIKIPVAEIDSFTFSPQAPMFQGYGIDLAATAQYGGMIYCSGVWNIEASKNAIYVYNTGIAVKHEKSGKWMPFPWSQINKDWKTLSGGREFRLFYDDEKDCLAIIYWWGELGFWRMIPISTNIDSWGAYEKVWEYNGGNPFINSSITQNMDKSVTITDGKFSSTAKEW